jgi:hypothetical protein
MRRLFCDPKAGPSAKHDLRMLRPSVLCMTLLACPACLADDPRPASWPLISATIIQPRCGTASCHSDLAQTAGLVLDSREAAFRSLVTMPPDGYGAYVVPGEPPASALLYLLRGEEIGRMPPDAPLSPPDIALIERWIADGANE